MKAILLASTLVIILCSSCSKTLTYYTEDLHQQHGWTENQLKKIQFYLSQDIELERSGSQGVSRIEDGQIKVRSNRKTDKIVIKKGTPGTLIHMPKENRYAISFDDSGEYLMFGPTKKNNGRFTLLAKEWLENRRGGIVSYGKKEYRINSESAYAALLVDIDKARTNNTRTDKASGRRVR